MKISIKNIWRAFLGSIHLYGCAIVAVAVANLKDSSFPYAR